LLTIKLPQTIGKFLVIGNWSIKVRGGNCLLLPVSSYAYGAVQCPSVCLRLKSFLSWLFRLYLKL